MVGRKCSAGSVMFSKRARAGRASTPLRVAKMPTGLPPHRRSWSIVVKRFDEPLDIAVIVRPIRSLAVQQLGPDLSV
jgi:hypothetical protein